MARPGMVRRYPMAVPLLKTIFGMFVEVPWLPILGTAITIFNCYLPGRESYWHIELYVWISVLIWWAVFVPAFKGRKGFKRRAIWPTLVLLCLTIIAATPIPLHLVFRIYQKDLDKFVQTHKEPCDFLYKQSLGHPPRTKIGPYTVFDYCVRTDGSVYLVTDFTGWGFDYDGIGFAYEPIKSMDSPFKFSHRIQLNESWSTFSKSLGEYW